MQDQEIKCQGVNYNTPCPAGAIFIHSVKDQEFYQRQGFEAPKRCRECREAKKAMKEQGGGFGGPQGGHREDRGHRGGRRDRHSDREMLGEDSNQG